MNKKILISIIIILILTAGIGVFFVFQKSVFIEESGITPPVVDYDDSPFGIMAAFDSTTLVHINTPNKLQWAGEQFQNLGAKFTRGGAINLIWDDIEPVLGQGYYWASSDEYLKSIYQYGGDNVDYIPVITSCRGKQVSCDLSKENETYFRNYVNALVERYDGDGIDDYSPIIKVKYWQAYNEPFPRNWVDRRGGTIKGFARFVEILSNAVRGADNEAKIILGACGLEEKEYVKEFDKVITEMKGKNLFDYVDTHYWNQENYKISNVDLARNILDKNGYSNAKFVSLEFASWRGHRNTEYNVAKYLIKGYLYNIANGFSFINWNNLVEWENFGGYENSLYNSMGLIADGINDDDISAGTLLLPYYSYKLMVEKLEGSDWDNIQTIQESNDVYIYKFTNKETGKSTWVAWNDNANLQTITLNVRDIKSVKLIEAVPKYETGKEILDYSTAFNIETKNVNNNQVSITLEDVPIFVLGD